MSKIAQLNECRLAWMASHINEAQFPTPESIQGLKAYQATQNDLPPALCDFSTNESLGDSDLVVYEVDCHPLIIRFASVLASQWADHQQAEVIEYLTQLEQDRSGKMKMFVGYVQQRPAVCATLYGDDDAFIIADLAGSRHEDQCALYRYLVDADKRQCINGSH